MTAAEAQENLTTKEALLLAAKKVFAAKGYDGATVKEVADEAGVNVSLVSYHFNGKENLFRACIQSYGEKRLLATETFLKSPQSAEDYRVRLTLYLEDYFQFAMNDQDTMIIMHRECMGTNPLLQDIFKNFFLKSVDNMIRFFGDAKAKGILRPDADPHYVTLVFMGAIIQVIQMNCAHENMFNTGLKDQSHREKVVSTLLQFLMGGAQS